MAKTRARALYVQVESTFRTDPDGTGANHLYIPALSIGDLQDGKELLPTNYANGENWPTRPIAGPDGYSFEFEVPVIGLATAAGAGTNASSVTADWLDTLLLNIFGSLRTTAGVAVSGGSSAAEFTSASNPYTAQDIVALFLSGVPTTGTRSQLSRVSTSTSPYACAPSFVATPTSGYVSYGGKIYTNNADGGASLTFVYVDDTDLETTCTGAKITSWELTGEVRGIWRLKLTVEGDTKSVTTKGTGLPDPSAPAVTPLITTLSPVFFNGSAIETRAIKISGGLTAQATMDSAAVNGRSGYINISYEPSVTIEPLRAQSRLDLKRNATAGPLMVQLGAGVLASGVLNLGAFYMAEAYANSVSPSDDGGRARQSVEFRVSNPGNFASNVLSYKTQFARF